MNQRRTAAYRATIAARRPYELRLRARNTNKGLRFDTPHDGACPQCSGSKRTCCRTKSITVGWEELGHFQRHQFGSERWADSYKRRTLVEGYFGNLKNASVGGHTRDTAQFFEYAKIVLAFTYNAMATNLARIASWRAQRVGLECKRRRSGRPNMNPTLDEIAGDDGLLEQVRDRKRRRRRGPPRRSKPERNPFAHLGAAPQ